MTQVFMDIIGAQGIARKTGPLTAGMVGVPVVFSFSPEWAELNCLAVFRAGEVKKDNTITDGCSVIPAEVLTQPGQQLYMGVEGRSKQGDVVIPTVWAEVGRILEGAQAANDPALAPTPSQFERFMAQVEQLDGKMESALQEAKASGEFDGKTPVKGVDYFTEEEKQEIAEQAAELVDVLNVDLSGYVKTVNGTAPDENGNVTVVIPAGGGSVGLEWETICNTPPEAGVLEVSVTLPKDYKALRIGTYKVYNATSGFNIAIGSTSVFSCADAKEGYMNVRFLVIAGTDDASALTFGTLFGNGGSGQWKTATTDARKYDFGLKTGSVIKLTTTNEAGFSVDYGAKLIIEGVPA